MNLSFRTIRGSNQHMLRMLPLEEPWTQRRHFSIKAKTWLSILLVIAIISPTVAWGFQAQQAAYNMLYVSPLPLEAQDGSVTYQVQYLPTTSETQAIYERAHGDLLYRVWTLESSRGKNGRLECQAKGLRNDFGFDVADHKCFTSFDQEVDTVNAWFDQELKAHSLAASLCIYNQGIDETDCTYARDFMGI